MKTPIKQLYLMHIKVGDTFLLNSNDKDIFRVIKFEGDRAFIEGVNNSRRGFVDCAREVFRIYEYANYKKDRTSFKWTR